jgi:hypothetical protein
MGLDLRQVTMPSASLILHQAGIRHLLPPDDGPAPASDQQAKEMPVPEMQEQYEAAEQGYPPPWSTVWSTLSPPYTMVWTYWQLSEDLGPSPDQQRRTLFKTILTSLCWPRGSVAFWPLTSYAPPDHTPRLDIFWSGVSALQAQMIVVFGARAFQTIFPERTPRFGFTSTPEGLQIVHVPGPQDMLPDNREMKNLTWSMLCPLGPSR